MAGGVGNRGKGRPKGARNKRTQSIEDRIAAAGGHPEVVLAQVANGTLPCGVCHGRGKTEFQPQLGAEPGVRRCQSCWGSRVERISPKERAWAAAELLSYMAPKKKAIEVTGAGGGPIPVKLNIVFVDKSTNGHAGNGHA